MTVVRRLTIRFCNLRSLRVLTALLAVVGVVFSESSRAAETMAALSGFAFESAPGRTPVVAVVSNTVVAFRAVTGKAAPPGLVPIFAVETQGRIELRRIPGKGQESFSDPVFFAWPPRRESEAGRVSGRWEALAIREDRSRHRFALELAVDGERVAARFDPDTDYRFAHLTDGRLQHGRLELQVAYLNDHYRLSVERRKDRWVGSWRLEDDSASGPLELWRDASATQAPPRCGAIGLHECRKAGSSERIYRLADEPLPPGWQRASPPLCEVWKPGNASRTRPR
ncbi:MAG: hypothetical protein NTX70_04685 [Verrucomicrobia bacterium]|nr:hypothetical protein [Verrucomicrobiota bacterium]